MGSLLSACLTSPDMAPLELLIERLINDAIDRAFAKINPGLKAEDVTLNVVPAVPSEPTH